MREPPSPLTDIHIGPLLLPPPSPVPTEPLLCKFADGGQKKRQSQGRYQQNGRPWTREGETVSLGFSHQVHKHKRTHTLTHTHTHTQTHHTHPHTHHTHTQTHRHTNTPHTSTHSHTNGLLGCGPSERAQARALCSI